MKGNNAPGQKADNPTLPLHRPLNQEQPAVRSKKTLEAYLFTKFCTAATRHPSLKTNSTTLHKRMVEFNKPSNKLEPTAVRVWSTV